MKRFISFLLACVMITSSLCIFPLAANDEGDTQRSLDADIELVYGGATGIFSMTFDDGDLATAHWLNEMFEKYDLYGSTMNIPSKNFATEELEQTWQNIIAKGRLEVENHSMTHAPLPAQWWSNYSKYEQNNTEEKYQYEIVDSYNRILEVTGRVPLCFAPSNNTLHDDAVKVVAQNHYVMRQGLRWNLSRNQYQSLDPIVNATYNQHETNNIAAGAGGWYNPYMMSFASNPIKDGLDFAATEGAWLITMCHNIGATGDVDFDVAIDFFEHAAKLQNEGKLWVTTFGNATKYIRERQNSVASAVMKNGEIYLTVTMTEKTADNLPLTEDVFNHPLTVKVETPESYTAVSYLINGTRKYAKTFVENGKTYALVDVVPNRPEVLVSAVDLGVSGVTPDTIGTILPDGTLSAGTATVDGGKTELKIDQYGKVYAKIDLSSFEEYNYASVVLDVTDPTASGKISVYAITDKTLAEGWSATSINAYNAPANDRFGPAVDLSKVMQSAPIADANIDGVGKYMLDITAYALEMLDRDATAGTLIFVLDPTSQSKSIAFGFESNSLYSKTISFDGKTTLTYPDGTSIAAYRAADIYSTGGLSASNFEIASDNVQKDALKVQTTASKWNLFKILNLFSEQLTTEDIGRNFVITFKMKETDSSNAKVNGIRMGMVGTHTSGANCGNVGGGSAPNVGTQYNSVVIQNTALDTWESFTYEFEITEDTFAGARPAQELGFYGNVKIERTLWFDDIVIEEKAPASDLYSHSQTFEDATVGSAVGNGLGFARLGFAKLEVTDEKNYTGGGAAGKSIFWRSLGKSWERAFFLPATPYGTVDGSKSYSKEDIGRQFTVTFMVNTPAELKLNLAMTDYENIQFSTLTDASQKSSYTIPASAVNTWVKISYTFTVTEDFLDEAGHFTTLMISVGKCAGASEDTPVDFYLDDFRVSESPAALYSHSQDCENSAVDAYPASFTKLGFGTFKVVDTMNATPGTASSKSIVYETIGMSYERIYYLGATPYSTKDATKSYSANDVGRTFRISFKVNTPAVTTFNMAMVCYKNQLQYSALTDAAQKASFTVTEDMINTWVKVEYTFTVTEAMLAEDGHFTEFLLAMGKCTGASQTNPQQIYLDDFKCQEIPSASSVSVICPVECATVGDTRELTVSYTEKEETVTATGAYIAFDRNALDAVTDGTLRLNLGGKDAQALLVLALREDLLAKLTEGERYELLSRCEIDYNYVWHGFDLAECAANEGFVEIDVSDYLKDMAAYGASFLIVQRDTLDTVFFEWAEGSAALTEGVDYTASVGASLTDDVLAVKAGSIALKNVLGYADTDMAVEATTYVVNVKTNAGVQASFLGTTATADENGEIHLTVTASENQSAPVLTLTCDNDFTVSEILVESTTANTAVTNVSLLAQYATDADYLAQIMQNVSLQTSIAVNFYLPVDIELKSVTNEKGDNLLDRENTLNIEGKEYYVVTNKTAPKDAYKTQTLTVTPEIGRAYVLDSSALHYAKNLLSLTPTTDYISDSQELIKYILNYIREAALALDDATEQDLCDFETDVLVGTELKEEIFIDLEFEGLEGFCLDLEDHIGIVIKVEQGFVGTVSASLEGFEETTLTFSEDHPADNEAYLVIRDLPVHALRRTVTIELTDASGSTSTYLCNVATYVKAIGSDLLYATYAYSVKAHDYVVKYPAVEAIK